MTTRRFLSLLPVAALLLLSCGKKPAAPDPKLSTLGTVEVTARLVEVPEGAIFKRDLYDYAAILKYEVIEGHRGSLKKGEIIHVGHYDPWKPRAGAADKRVKLLGGNLEHFLPDEVHRMAMEVPMDEHYLGGIVDPYFGKHDGPVFWAVWSNAVP